MVVMMMVMVVEVMIRREVVEMMKMGRLIGEATQQVCLRLFRKLPKEKKGGREVYSPEKKRPHARTHALHHYEEDIYCNLWCVSGVSNMNSWIYTRHFEISLVCAQANAQSPASVTAETTQRRNTP